jgi:hypothetical protein
MRPRHVLVSVLLLTAGALLRPAPGFACAPVSRPNTPVAIASESAIILWDAGTKTQHFIRRASFDTGAEDFGFLVPTPTEPKLAEAGDEAFSTLASITAPRVITQPRPNRAVGCVPVCAAAPMPGNKAAQVEVLDEGTVGKYHYAVLAADDANALTDWLKKEGYESSPALAEWLTPYVKEKWKVTAFKIEKGAEKDAKVATSAVRMSFQAEQPFFPYREPAAQGGDAFKGPRLLRVYFLADKRYQGQLGTGGKPWPGEVVWANLISADDRTKLLDLVKHPADTPPGSWWLTEFEDSSSPRPGAEDVFFSPSHYQSTVERPPIVKYVSGEQAPGCVLCYAAAAFMVGSYVARRRR